MKRIHTLLLTAAVLLAGSACQPQKNPADYDRFVIEKTAVAADFEGGTASVVVNTNGNWTARFDQDYDWITANTLSGRGTGDILLTIAPNTGLEREATLVIEAPGYEPIVIAISQEAVKSNMRLGDPIPGTPPVKGVADAFTFQLPYVNALGNESVTLLLSFTGTGAAGLETQSVTVNGFTAGEGQVTVTVKGTPTALGPMTLTAEVSGDQLEPLSVRTVEQIAYQHYINWNNWSIGWTRSDFNLLRGSAYDYSWTSEAVHATESGVGTDHIALPTGTTLTGCEDAYLSLVCANPIVAAGKASGPTGTPSGLQGYQFNPGYQVQGMVKDDYVFVYIPKVSIAAGGTITLESSLGGATAASCVFLVEYSSDNVNWTAFGDTKTLEVAGNPVEYHYRYIAANSGMRYVYARDSSADPAYDVIHATVPAAINGPLYVRFRSLGVNGNGAVQTGKGWSDIKFIDISFQ